MDPKTISDCLGDNIEYGIRAGYISSKDISALFFSMAEHQGLGPLQCFFEESLSLITRRMDEKHGKQQKLPEA